MKKAWKYVAIGAAAVAALVPFKVKLDDENGEFEYRSLLLGVHKKNDPETGKANVSISFFNLPKCKRKEEEPDYTDDVAEGEGVLIMDESELAPTPEDPAAAEEPAAPAEPEAKEEPEAVEEPVTEE